MKTFSNLESLLTAHGLYGQFECLKPHIRSSIHIELESTDDSSIAIGSSKMGGLPDLPKDIDWFHRDATGTPMTFVCQINFAEVKPYDANGELPDSGILYLFYDYSMDGTPWGFDPMDADGKIVYYYDGDLSKLERKKAPENIEENGCVFGTASLSFETVLDLPDLESFSGEALRLSENDFDKYCDMLDELSAPAINKLLGHSNNIQGGMELECELVSNGLYCGNSDGYREGQAKGMKKNVSRWRLLLQVDSNEELGMMWEDCGRLYLWITDEDLAAKNFSASWLILQCY